MTTKAKMPLASQVWRIWTKHRAKWGKNFALAGLDLSSATEKNLPQLLAEKIDVKRHVKGIEEFSRDGHRGIEPGDPSRSLFYHIFASPQVCPDGLIDDDYLELADLEIIENYVYSTSRPTVADLRERAAHKQLAIVVFAYEYATAIDTVHRRHADLCFSRTGIARVGNAEWLYLKQERGFFPHSGKRTSGSDKVHVVPSRFGAFIACQVLGGKDTIGPENFGTADAAASFWVPLHKLFSGNECIRGLDDLECTLSAHHVNEKIKRVHLALRQQGAKPEYTLEELEAYPFTITEDLAKFYPEHGLVVPVPHNPLIEPATRDNPITGKEEYVGFEVPKESGPYAASLWFKEDNNATHSPEFVHGKHAITGEGKLIYLPDDPAIRDITKYVQAGGYRAANFADYTADGWVDVDCPTLAIEIPKRLAAYSVLAQPDFFPRVKQQDLWTWWKESAPEEIKDNIWSDNDTIPEPLSAERLPANFQLTSARFDSRDTTMTAIVSADRTGTPPGPIMPYQPRRESTLSYRASNVFEPGWDSAKDFNRDANTPQGTFHLASYGLGSPFAEDTLICASTGAFWPGTVPDVTRFFAPGAYPSVTPLLDDESSSYGSYLPKSLSPSGTYQYNTYAYADYVRAIWKKKLPYERFAEISLEDYITRTLAAARVFQVLGVIGREHRASYPFLRFRKPTKAELKKMADADIAMHDRSTFRVELAQQLSHPEQSLGNSELTTVKLGTPKVFFTSPQTVVEAPSGGGFVVHQF